jgi:preprotein translocase subunit Sec63
MAPVCRTTKLRGNRILFGLAFFVCFFAIIDVGNSWGSRNEPKKDKNAGRDFYKILSIERNATEKEIKKAYKKLSIENHPDKNQDDPEAKNKFAEIASAYEVLSEPERRRKYDRLGEEGMMEAE